MLRKIVGTILGWNFFTLANGTTTNLGDIRFETADGMDASLADYEGMVVLLVNVASRCGFTKQYADLQALYAEMKERGFVILAFPTNDFASQEPDSVKEIQKFCKARFGVTFPIMEKVHVKGENRHPLFEALVGKGGAFPGKLKWNFTKFLIGRDGKPIAAYGTATEPFDQRLYQEIENALAKS